MADLETRLPELLRDLSTDAPAEAGRSRPILRRARRRRALVAGTTGLTVVAVAAATVIGVRALTPADRSTIGNSSPSPIASGVAPPAGAIDAVWPETTADGLAFAQQQVDDGHQPWRTDPRMTAEAFAVNMLVWSPQDVRSRLVPTRAMRHTAIVAVHRAGGPSTEVMLAQLGATGADGAWSVTRADTPLLETSVEDAGDGTRSVRVRLLRGSGDLGVQILDGALSESSVSGPNAAGESTSFGLPSESSTGDVVVVVSLLGSGHTVAADVFSVRTATGPDVAASATATPEPSALPSSQTLPAAVAATRAKILRAIRDGNISALGELIDPNTFAYNFDDGSNPIPAWKATPSALHPIPSILALTSAKPKRIEGYGTFYIWPYLVDSDFHRLAPSEIDDLHSLGFDDAAIDDMRRFGSYTGPRLSIDQNGLWRNYTTGGD